MKNLFILMGGRIQAAAILAGAIGFISSSAHAQTQPTAKSLEYATSWTKGQTQPALTNFAAWTERFLANNGTVAEGVALAQQRQAVMVELIKTHPDQALAAAVPADVRQQLPAAVAAELETRVSGIGDLSVLVFCPNQNGTPVQPIQRTAKIDGQTYQAYVFGRRTSQGSKLGIPLHGIAVGGVLALHESSVRELEETETAPATEVVVELTDPNNSTGPAVVGQMGGTYYRFASRAHLESVEAALEQAESGIAPQPARPAATVMQLPSGNSSSNSTGANAPNPPTAWTTGLKKILVIRVDFSDLPGDPSFPGGPAGTAAFMQNLMDTQIAPFYAKSSYGQTTLTNTVSTQLYRMPQTAASYATAGNNGGLHADAETLAAANYTLANYDRIVVVFSYLGNLPGSSVNYGGLAQITGPSVWVNGEFDFRVLSHELGHTYGLFHAGLWQVTDGNPLSAGGSTIEYGDDFDTMGANFANSQSCDFNPFYKNMVGWITDAQVRTIGAGGVYRINTFDSVNFANAASDTTLALKLVRDSQHTYWVGVRRSFTSNPYQQGGVYVIWGLNSVGGGGGGGFQSQLLDFNTPGAAPSGSVNDDYDSALQFHQPLIDSSVGLRLNPLSEGGNAPNTYVDIQIGAGGAPDLRITTNSITGGNGNGLVDPNECNSIFLVLTNVGLGGGTNVQGILSTTNANVIVSGKSSFYPNLPAGASGTNLVAYQFSTSPNFVCGTPVNFALTLKADQFAQTNYFTVASGVGGAPKRFDSVGTAPIPDLSSGDLPLVVTNFNTAILKATISIHLQHTYDSDLRIQLISPEGITNLLCANVGGSRDNFGTDCSDTSRTIFDDDASLSINSGSAPFVGSFRPVDPLSVFIGKVGASVNGTWHLHVVDEVGIDFGSIECWSLFLDTPVCSDGGGECPGSDLAIGGSVAPEPLIIGGNLTYNLSITNLGPKTAQGVSFSQTLPPSTVFVGASISQGSISYSGNNINGNVGNLPVGAVVTAAITVLPTQAGTFTSTAAAAAVADPDYDLSNNSITFTSHINPPTADLGVGIAANPNPVLVGGTLTYTVSVTNNGPSTATGVVLSNNFPASVAITSANPQGLATIAGNSVIFSLGALSPGAITTATVTVIPSALGQITATATVRGNQFDPFTANNSASVSSLASPSADLAVGFVSVPGSIVLGNTLNYTINATNLGPSIATSVFISQTLPANAQLNTFSSTLGTVSVAGNFVTCDVGSLGLGAVVTMNVQVLITTNEIATSTANISGALTDVNTANNSATVNTVVAPPYVNIQAASALLLTESYAPANGAVDPGETVTVQLYLKNIGNVSTTNMTATLLATGGVTAPGAGAKSYTLSPGGFPDSKPFNFTATGTNGGSVTATLQVTNNGTFLTNVSFVFAFPKVASFANTNAIVIPDSGIASPYPSTITVSGVTGLVGKVTATLANFNHTYPHDVSVLLVSPAGIRSVLMSHTADLGAPEGNVTLTFDDSAAAMLPASGSAGSGAWQPSGYAPIPVFPNPAPTNNYGSAMSVFNSTNPNGTWSLFVLDDAVGDQGIVSNGWSLAITTISAINQVADLSLTSTSSAGSLKAGDSLTNSFTLTNTSTNTVNAVTFTSVLSTNVSTTVASVSVSQGNASIVGGTITANVTNLLAGASATVIEVFIPNAAGSLTNTANVSAAVIDLVPGNNTNVIVTTVTQPSANLSVTLSAAAATVVTGSNVVYTIAITNLGPDTALNTVVTNYLPAGLTAVVPSLGTLVSSKLTCSLGNVAAGAGTVITVSAHAPVTPGTLTNSVVVATTSTDAVPANNSASLTTAVRIPAALITAISARLVTENIAPANGTVEAGETVTLALSLANTGEIDTTSLVATLLNTGGITASSGSANYGAVVRNGPAVAGNFTCTASVAASGSVTATLQLQDGAVNLGTVAFTFLLPQTTTFANTNGIIIPDHGVAAPYPATITVSGVTGLVSKVTLALNGLSHSFPRDIGVLLVSPAGAKSVVMSGVGGGNSITNLTLSFDDAAATSLSDSGGLVAGISKPTSFPASRAFPNPAPAGNSTALLSQLNGGNPNGVWSLYVVDDVNGDGGNISQGWSLTITTVSTINPAADLSVTVTANTNAVIVGGAFAYNVSVLNNGPATATGVFVTNTLPAGATLGVVTFSSGGTYSVNGSQVICSFNNLSIGASASATIGVTQGVAGLALNSASVTANETDLYLLNNSASVSVNVTAITQARLSGILLKPNGQFQFTLTGQDNFTYIVQARTNLTSGAWVAISTNTAVGGTFQFIDTNAPGLPQRFYRTVQVP